MPSARKVQWAKIRTGATAFVALLILGVFLVLMTGGRLFRETDTVRILVPDSAGLAIKSPVRLNGIPIGSIKGVRLSHSPDPNRTVEILIEIDHAYLDQITVDSVASITAEDIQGDKAINIDQGTARAHVRSGGEVKFQVQPETFKTLDLVQFDKQLRLIDAMLADIQAGKGPVGELIQKDTIYRETLARITQLQKAVAAATSTEQNLGQLLYRGVMYEQLSAPVRQLDEALAKIQRGEGGTGALLTSTAQYDELHTGIANIRQQLADLNAGKGGGRFLTDDAMYRQWTSQVGGFIASVDRLNAGEGTMGRLLVDAQPYESLSGSLREFGATLRDFQQNPRKYVRFRVF
jgi:phospholipid/cholesterol/gamma-HCH transport system substrate-binding protein